MLEDYNPSEEIYLLYEGIDRYFGIKGTPRKFEAEGFREANSGARISSNQHQGTIVNGA